MATAKTNSNSRLCLAATVIQVAVSAISATTAIGGLPARAVPITPTTEVCTTAARLSTRATTIRATVCIAFGV